MKKTTIFFVVLYIVIIGLISWWFYNRFFKNQTTQNTTSPVSYVTNKTIFYTVQNNLFLLNSDNLNKSSADTGTIRLQSTGQIQTVVLDQNKEFIIYDSITPQNNSEIWQVSFSDNHSEKLFGALIPGFENYTNFRSPVVSKTGRYLSFIATNNEIDDIFVLNIDQNSVQNLTNQTVKNKIASIIWSYSEPKIYYATGSTEGSINLLDLERKTLKVADINNEVTKMTALKDGLVLKISNDTTSNLSYMSLATPEVLKPITDLTQPKTVKNFDLSTDGQRIVYQVENSALKTNDLYIVKIDGTNLLQLTTDGKSKFAIFSPDNAKIAYWLEGSGIYTIGLTKENPQKILNEKNIINSLNLWR